MRQPPTVREEEGGGQGPAGGGARTEGLTWLWRHSSEGPICAIAATGRGGEERATTGKARRARGEAGEALEMETGRAATGDCAGDKA